jgi:hypothetical protein
MDWMGNIDNKDKRTMRRNLEFSNLAIKGGVEGPASCEKAAKRCTSRNWTVGPTLNKEEMV